MSLTCFITLWLITSLARGLPLDGRDKSASIPRTTAEVTQWDGLPNSPNASRDISIAEVAYYGTNTYQLFTGHGHSWPIIGEWVDFDTMFNNNKPLMRISCTQFHEPNNSEDEIRDIYNAIGSATTASGVDSRFILATILQESGGCVRAPTTYGSVPNPGLMQDHDGSASCSSTNPCPSTTITQMVSEGTSGTPTGAGLAGCIQQAVSIGATGATTFYWAARIYNTGSYIAGADLGSPQYGTSCYCSDIANRLLGWAGTSSLCDLPNP